MINAANNVSELVPDRTELKAHRNSETRNLVPVCRSDQTIAIRSFAEVHPASRHTSSMNQRRHSKKHVGDGEGRSRCSYKVPYRSGQY